MYFGPQAIFAKSGMGGRLAWVFIKVNSAEVWYIRRGVKKDSSWLETLRLNYNL